MQLELEKKKEKESKIQALKDQEENELVRKFLCSGNFVNGRVLIQMLVNDGLTLMVGGFDCARTALDGYFAMKKGVWRSQISRVFVTHQKLAENLKIVIYTVISGHLEGMGSFNPPLYQHPEAPHYQGQDYQARINILLFNDG